MTEEKAKLIADLGEREKVLLRLDELKKKREKTITEKEKEIPREPTKWSVKPLSSELIGKGIRLVITLVLCIAVLIASILCIVKSNQLSAINDDPGAEFESWCELLVVRGSFETMTAEDWEPVQKAWEERGASISWEEFDELIKEKGSSYYENPSRNYAGDLCRSLSYIVMNHMGTPFRVVWGIGLVVLVPLALILILVWRKGFRIPGIVSRNKKGKEYNENIYPKRMQEYEDAIAAHKKSLNEALEQIDQQIKQVEEESSNAEHFYYLNSLDIVQKMIKFLWLGQAENFKEAHELAYDEYFKEEKEREAREKAREEQAVRKAAERKKEQDARYEANKLRREEEFKQILANNRCRTCKYIDNCAVVGKPQCPRYKHY